MVTFFFLFAMAIAVVAVARVMREWADHAHRDARLVAMVDQLRVALDSEADEVYRDIGTQVVERIQG